MTAGPSFVDRRKHPRYRLQAGAYVVNAARPGLITDISLDGLSWRYVDRKHWADGSPTLDILIEGRGTSVAGLPYRVVSDGPAEPDGPDQALAVRRRSVQFGALTPDHRAQLEALIRQHVAASAQVAFAN